MESFGSPSNKISHIEKIMKKYDLTPGEITFLEIAKQISMLLKTLILILH